MAAPDPRWQQLRAAFSAELIERARELNRLLLRLENGRDDQPARAEQMRELFREAHNLKGAARAVGLERVERLAHGLEAALDEVRRGARPVGPRWFDAVYRAVDAFAELDRESEHEPSVDVEVVLADLAAPTDQPGEPPPEDVEPAPPASEPPPASGPTRPDQGETVRVALAKLDALLAQAGELTVVQQRIARRSDEMLALRRDLQAWRRKWRAFQGTRERLRRLADAGSAGAAALVEEVPALVRAIERADARVRELTETVELLSDRLRRDASDLDRLRRRVGDEVIGVRLLPFASILPPLERMVRDIARALGKDARLVTEGGGVEVDRRILEQMRDPLMHMLRNAVDHGIERPDERAARGKPRVGTIGLTVARRGGSIEIELADDGAGLDPERLRRVAVERGLLAAAEAAGLDDELALGLIFRPGFSTSPTVTDLSGRGVGMDVVQERVRALGGQITLGGRPGLGARVTIELPLTLTTSRAILLEQGGQLFALPSATVERDQRVRARDLTTFEGRAAIVLNGQPIAAVELAELLERPPTAHAPADWRPFFVLRGGDRRVAFLVDRLIGAQEIVVKPLGWPLKRVRNVAGATVLGSGETVVVLEPADLLRSAARLVEAGRASARAPGPAAERRQRVLVVDDSLTTRSLERSILESRGYEVVVASDGVEALDLLRGQAIDLVVTDLEMPRMDGYALTAEIRRDERLRRLPVVLVTSLDSREHRERGVAVGADAYIVKSGFDQEDLVETVRRLL